jgi:hypothetical protein
MKKICSDESRYYPCECPKCGWIGSSESVGGGGFCAGCDDYDDIYCPKCSSEDIEDRGSIYYPYLYPLKHWIKYLLLLRYCIKHRQLYLITSFGGCPKCFDEYCDKEKDKIENQVSEV